MIFGKYINCYYKKYWYYFAIGIAAIILVDIVQLYIPEIIGNTISGLTNNTFVNDDYVRVLLSLVCIGLAMFVGRFIWRICINGVGARIEYDLRGRLFLHAESLPAEYYKKQKTGAMMALYTNDLETIKSSFTDGVLFLIDGVVLGGLAMYKLVMMNWVLALVCIIPLGLMAACGGIIGKAESAKFEARQAAFEKMSDFVQENITGISVIKAFVKEAHQMRKFAQLNKNNEVANIKYLRYSILLNTVINFLIYVVAVIIILLGGYFALTGQVIGFGEAFDGGKLSEFYGYFDTLIWPMLALSMLIDIISRSRASYRRMAEFFKTESTVVDKKEELMEDIPAFSGSLRFNNLDFCYSDEMNKPVLKEINLEIKAGENVGIVGRTGSGKTTLINTILKIYNIPKGKLFIDDIDINYWPTKVVREHVGYVAQDSFLFSDIVANNIAFANPQYSMEEVKKAAQFACVDSSIVEFKDGYNTMVGERGVTLSGGQKQRIAMARAIVKNPEILILDDSVSAVDSETEKEILENIKTLRKGKTTLIVAHRISAVENLDHIIVMDDGRVVGYGTHDELLKTCKTYAKIVELQQLEKEVN